MGITLDELIFDPSNPDDGANVGATLRGADGTVIGNTADALKVDIGSVADLDIRDLAFATDKVDVTGSEVSLDAATLAALENTTVTIANAEVEISNDAGNPIPMSATDLDIRDLTFATDKVDASGSEVSLDAATLAALESVTVTATDLDIRDLAFATDSVDVSGSSVNIGGKSSGQYKATSVTSTAAQIDASPLASRKNITIQNLGTKDIWIGFDSSVTATNGTKVPRGGSADFDWSDSLSVFAITSSGTADVRLLETA